MDKLGVPVFPELKVIREGLEVLVLPANLNSHLGEKVFPELQM